MSLIKTHHDLLIREKCCDEFSYENINRITTEITFQVIAENPNLINDIESGLSSKEPLKQLIIEIIDKMNLNFKRDEIIKNVFNYMFGYGILQEYIENEDISDIDGSRYNFFTIKRDGKKEIIPVEFTSAKEFERYCKLIIIRNGGIINENDSHERVADVNNRLRINVTIPPRSMTGPAISIRKHRKKAYNLEDLCYKEMMSFEVKEFLKRIMEKNSRIIISGKGAAGKTTLLRALLMESSSMERILVCEKDSELFISNPNVIVHRIKKAKDKKNEITLKDLVADGLTMSLDGYCVGEIIGDEAWDFIKAGHTDHKIFGTIHANSERDVVDRLSMLIENVTKLSESRLERIIYQSLDYIIHLKDFKIQKIVKINFENGEYGYDQLF